MKDVRREARKARLDQLLSGNPLTEGMYVRAWGDHLIIGRHEPVGPKGEMEASDRLRLTVRNTSSFGLSVRRHTDHPFILDESIDGLDVLLRGHADAAMDCVNIKISKFGGLTKAKQARDLCVALGIAMTIEDSWGGDVVTAAIAHLAHSTPTELLFTATDFNSYVTVSTAEGAPQRDNGRMRASTEPGLGIAPRMDVLGDPVVDLSA